MTPTSCWRAATAWASQMVHLMCDDLTEDEFRHQPVAGANSAAWIVGHLAVTARRTAERLGATDLPVLTEEFIGRYSQTKKPAECKRNWAPRRSCSACSTSAPTS